MEPRPFGRYQLLNLLATGGMGEVYLAVDRGSAGASDAYRKPCVVKRILPALVSQPDVVAMFAREATFAAQLGHANIVSVLDHGIIDGQPYTAMEFVHGINAKALLEMHQRSGTPVPLHVAAHILQGCMSALAYAHHKRGWDGQPLQLVHRDVSPHNLMLSLSGEVKLTDFGMVKGTAVRGVYQTTENTLRGKLAYMSPEQASGAPVDQRSDLFTWGVLAYELLTLRHPFAEGADGLDLLDRIKRSAHVPLATVAPHVPAALVALVERCLRADPADRPASSLAVRDEMEELRASTFATASNAALATHLGALPIPPLPEPVVTALARPERSTRESVAPVAHSMPPRPRTRTAESAVPVVALTTPVLAPPDGDTDPVIARTWSTGRLAWVVVLGAVVGAGVSLWSRQSRREEPPPATEPTMEDAGSAPVVLPPRKAPPRKQGQAPVDLREVPALDVAGGGTDLVGSLKGAQAREREAPDRGSAPSTVAPAGRVDVPVAAPGVATLDKVVPPASPGMPPGPGLRYASSGPAELKVGGRVVDSGTRGELALDGPGPHAVDVHVAGVQILTLTVTGEGSARRMRLQVRTDATARADGRPTGQDADMPVRASGSDVVVAGATFAVHVTVR